MNLINAKQVKAYCHENQKQVSKEALEALNFKVMGLLDSAIRLSGRFTRITDTEINMAK
jgi:hypothetical protein